jgi:hypothetical protein
MGEVRNLEEKHVDADFFVTERLVETVKHDTDGSQSCPALACAR